METLLLVVVVVVLHQLCLVITEVLGAELGQTRQLAVAQAILETIALQRELMAAPLEELRHLTLAEAEVALLRLVELAAVQPLVVKAEMVPLQAFLALL
jgi:hypothetical protein